MGSYEHVILTAGAEVEGPSEAADLLLADAQTALEKALETDIQAVRDASGLTADQSFIFHWKQESTE